MKKYIFYTLAFSMLVLVSCSKSFLDSEPIVNLTDGNFYKTKADAELAVVGCYDGIQVLYGYGVGFPILSEVLSDNCYGATGNNDGLGYQVLDEFDIMRSPGDVGILNDNWERYYKAIYRMNVLLQKMDQINWDGDEASRNSIEAQARFLRAYCYFDMVRIWEKVPLLLEPTDEFVPQATANETYTAIADDLLFAATNGDSTVSAGRVNKWAAKSMLARVFLFYTGYYNQSSLPATGSAITKAQVLQDLEQVIARPEYGLVENFKDLWPGASSYIEGDELKSDYVGKDNKETVFAIKYNITSDWDGNEDGNHWLIMMGLRVQTFPPYGYGWGACTVLPELYNAFADGDVRRDASIIGMEEEGIDFDTEEQREYTGYNNKKYIPISMPDGTDVTTANDATSFMTGQFQDYVVIRYADVLLMAAELGSPKAQEYYDNVRLRAGLTSRPATLANILEERRFEFAFEGLRYWDLLRQGISTAANALAISTTVLNGGVETTKTISASKVTTTKGFQQIPQQQITRSGGQLEQNAGW